MGESKAEILIDGEPVRDRIVRLLREAGLATTVLGPEGLRDSNPGAGPLAAIGGFVPDADWVWVMSCDVLCFDAKVVELLYEKASSHEAVVPRIADSLQLLCALYSKSAFERARALADSGEERVQVWVDSLDTRIIQEKELREAGIDPITLLGANTPAELQALIQHRRVETL